MDTGMYGMKVHTGYASASTNTNSELSEPHIHTRHIMCQGAICGRRMTAHMATCASAMLSSTGRHHTYHLHNRAQEPRVRALETPQTDPQDTCKTDGADRSNPAWVRVRARA